MIYTSSTINNDKKQPDSTLSLLHGHALPQVSEMIDLLPDKHFALAPICQPAGERMPHPYPQHNPKLCSRHASIFIFSFFFFCSVQLKTFLELFRLRASEGLNSCREVQCSFQSQSGLCLCPPGSSTDTHGKPNPRGGFLHTPRYI